MPLVPADFEVPNPVSWDGLTIRLLSTADPVRDYEACMTSTDHLAAVFHPDAPPWPTRDHRCIVLAPKPSKVPGRRTKG